jgi:CRISPR-associated endonuclease Cas1
MTATKNVARLPFGNPNQKPSPRDLYTVHFHRLFGRGEGVVVLVGYGINVRVDRGHLILEDGISNDRREGRFPRVHHGLRRVIVIGSDGMVSLAALRWLADQNIAFAMLERDGSVLLSTGPVAASDTRLRRAQACAVHSPAAVDIVRHLVGLKLSGQEALVREKLGNGTAADLIARSRAQLDKADSIDDLRMYEGHGGSAYWTAWQNVEIRFPKSDLARVPEHWKTFGTRRSPISGTSRRPPNPVNAILNYLYTLLESETRLAITALGLDPGFGLLHVDHATRDSLVYDLMEPVRPKIDSYVLDWITSTPLKRSWFFEQRDGTCRLMADLTSQLADTASTWSREVAPLVEWFAHTLASTAFEDGRVRAPGTRLTQRKRYEGQRASVPLPKTAQKQNGVCGNCGCSVSPGIGHCEECGKILAGRRLAKASQSGRVAALKPEALAKRSNKMLVHQNARRAWKPSDLPTWLNDEVYVAKIQPLLANTCRAAIQSALGVCQRYAYEIASGERIPHRRHWAKLAELVGFADHHLQC